MKIDPTAASQGQPVQGRMDDSQFLVSKKVTTWSRQEAQFAGKLRGNPGEPRQSVSRLSWLVLNRWSAGLTLRYLGPLLVTWGQGWFSLSTSAPMRPLPTCGGILSSKHNSPCHLHQRSCDHMQVTFKIGSVEY